MLPSFPPALSVFILSLLISVEVAQARLGAIDTRYSSAEPTYPQVYFGNGCFFGRQHLYAVDLEQDLLHKTDAQVTAVGGYAGGKKAGEGGRLCYYNPLNIDVYADLGHAEVVGVSIDSEDVMYEAALLYFKSFIEVDTGVWGREDYFDTGAGYRALIGLPGGMSSHFMPSVHKANVHNMTLKVGMGSEADTLGNNTVYVMDSTHFPFYQAELCLQFHNNVTSTYPASYHVLQKILLKEGRICDTHCPENYICNPPPSQDDVNTPVIATV